MTVTSNALSAERWDGDVDAHIAKLNARVGESGPAPLFSDGPYAFPIHQSQVTADMIRLFARSIGDRNPLWRDEGYAQNSRWGGLIGPPIFEAALAESPSMPNAPQIRGWNVLQGGFHRRYIRPFRPGDIVHGKDTWLGFKEKSQPDRTYRLFIQSCERAYIDQNDEVICRVTGRMASTAARPMGGDAELRVGPDWTSRLRRRLSAEEIEEIQRGYNREINGENCRGARPRYWEDVHIGDEIPALVKGPYDISDAVAFAGVLNLCSGFAAKWEAMRPDLGRHPPDPETGAPRHAIDWHLEDAIGRQHGLPYAHAFGTHMEMMMVHPVTNWMGDAAAIIEIDTQLRSILLLGEVSRTTAYVAGKREEEGRHLAEIAVASHVQTGVGENGVRYAHGTVVVELPSVTAAK